MTFDLTFLAEYWPGLLRGFGTTLWLCVAAGIAASTFGVVLVFGQQRGGPVLSALIRVYTAITLGLPLLVLLYVMFFILPQFGAKLSPKVVGTVTLTIYYAPYVAEVIRAAVAAVPVGTVEAGVAIGMSNLAIARRIIAKQALPLLLPTLAGLMIGLVKDSALLSVISVHEFMYAAKEVVSDTYAPLEVYFVVALVYWGATSLIHFSTRLWERRLGRTQLITLPR